LQNTHASFCGDPAKQGAGMKNPFVTGHIQGVGDVFAFDANSRIAMAGGFTKSQCANALKVKGLQSTVRKAIERRLRELNRKVPA